MPSRKTNVPSWQRIVCALFSVMSGRNRGPLSVNPIGVYDGLLIFTIFPAGSEQTDWNSFNVGEFFFPKQRKSLLPLLIISGGLFAFLIALARRRDRLSESASNPSA